MLLKPWIVMKAIVLYHCCQPYQKILTKRFWRNTTHIQGNECAHRRAKKVLELHHITEIKMMILKYNGNWSRSNCIMLARLRVGKYIFYTKHYFEKTDPPKCTNCDAILAVPHILNSCPISKLDGSLEEILGSIILKCAFKHNIVDV